MSSGVGIDTNIWEYAYIQPRIPDGDALHREARRFLTAVLGDTSRPIIVSEYQICEVLEVFRKIGGPPDIRQRLDDLFWSQRCQVVRCSTEVVREACALSAEASIHVYDYLVALPLRGLVDVIYSADEHFQHSHFQAIARVENPLSWVMREGRLPEQKA